MTITLDDIDNIEGGSGEHEYYASIQRAINGGLWSFQGSYGRAMMEAIRAGKCMLGRQDARDYWGNLIPSRTQVKEGTKGSYSFVADNCGEDWAAKMDAI